MNISLEERIYGLSLIWREAKYNFAYWDERPDLDWDKAYQEALPRIIAEENPYLYYRELQKFISLLRDGHTSVTIPEELHPEYNADEANIATSYIEGKHILMKLPESCGVPLYSEITSVNDTPLNEYLEKHIFPYCWHEKLDAIFKYGLLAYTVYQQERESVTIGTPSGNFTYTCGEKVNTIDGNWDYALKTDDYNAMQVIFESNVLRIEITSDNIAYIFVPSFGYKELVDELYANINAVKKCKGFIIDVRNNGGGNSAYAEAVASLFFRNAFKKDIVESPLYIASHAAHGKYNEKRAFQELTKNDYTLTWRAFSKRPVCLKQPVVVLMGCQTASAAESFLIFMKHKNRATLVGSPSYGSNGQPIFGDLPGGGRYAICTMKCYDSKGGEYINIGIQPDIFIENTIQNHINKFDAVFDKGISVLRK
jgi:hypothetical protein